MNLRELNHILIPKAAFTWDAWERTRTGRVLRPLVEVLGSITTEGQVVFVAMLIAGAAGIDVRFSHLYLVFSGLFGLMVAALLLRPLGYIAADELHIRVEHPAHVTAGSPLLFTLVLRNTGRRTLHALRVSGPFLPWDGQYDGAAPQLSVLAVGAEARLTIQTRFLVRGARTIGAFTVGSVRPLGLARGNRLRSAMPRFMVLPQRVPVVELPLPPLRYAALGQPSASIAGESFELLGVRPYRPGDRPRDLHARAWARHGIPLVRELRHESHRRAGVIVDLTAQPSRELADVALGLAGGLAQYLVDHGVVVDVAVIGQQVKSVTVGARAAGIEAAWELLALAEVGASEASTAAPGCLPWRAWSACHAVVAHTGTGTEQAAWDRLETLRAQSVELRTYAARDRVRGTTPAADWIFEEKALRAGTPVVAVGGRVLPAGGA